MYNITKCTEQNYVETISSLGILVFAMLEEKLVITESIKWYNLGGEMRYFREKYDTLPNN